MRGKAAGKLACSFAFLSVLLAALFLAGLHYGSVRLSAGEIRAALFQGTGTSGAAGRIVRDIRMPRVLAAALLGGALSVSGYLLQTFFANPIAGPFVLGISSGAKLSVSLLLIVSVEKGIFTGSGAMILAAFAGALLSMGFVLALSGRVRSMSVLVVCGVMLSYVCSAITDFLAAFADDANIVNLHNWSMGSFSGISWENVRAMAVVAMAGLAGALALAKPIGAYRLGEAYAQSVGVHIRRFRVCLVLLSSILSACVTAFAGPVSFVGIAVPHLMKGLFRTTGPLVMIPGCFLGGAAFCLLCDLIARTAFAPTELNISSVTAVFGAPVVIYLMLRGSRARGGREA